MDWPKVKLGEISSIIMGQAPPSKSYNKDRRGVPFVKVVHFGRNRPEISEWTDEPKKMAKQGDVLICVVGKVGVTNLGVKAAIGRSVAAIRPDMEKLDQFFLRHYLRTKMYQFTHQGQGAIQKVLTSKMLESMEIPDITINEQKRIAAILDKADEVERETVRIQEMRDEIIQATFLDMFGNPVTNPKGWDIVELGDICKLQGGFSFKSADYVKHGVRLVKIANVHYEELMWEDVSYLPESYLTKYKDFILNEGDILMALTRPIIKSLGTVKAVTVKQSDLPCLLNQRVARFEVDEKNLNSKYLLGIIYGDYYKSKIEKFSSTSLQPNVSNRQIESIEIPLPPIELQNQFADIVYQINSLDLSTLETQATTLKAALSQELLS